MAQLGERTSLYITTRTKEKLQAICDKRGENRSRVINELIDHEYMKLEKDDGDIKKDF